MKKTIFVLIAAVMATVIAMAATGCGKSSDESSQASTIPKATNATSAPTEAASYGRYNSNATTATRPTNMTTGATSATEDNEPATQAAESSYLGDIAMNYFSVSSDVGATAEMTGTETAPNGVTFYLYTVYYAGNAYPLYVSADGSELLEPEYYQSYVNNVSSGSGNSDSNNTVEEYNEVETYAAY